MPYWFDTEQIDLLIRVIGNDIDNGSHELDSVNDEIGILQAREDVSKVNKKLALLYPKKKHMLMLSERECQNIVSIGVPEEIEKVLVNDL